MPIPVEFGRLGHSLQIAATQPFALWVGIQPEKSASRQESADLPHLAGSLFPRTNPAGCSEALFSLVVMCVTRFCNYRCTERNRIGDARKKRGSQWPRATLRREVHAAQEVLEARVGAQVKQA